MALIKNVKPGEQIRAVTINSLIDATNRNSQANNTNINAPEPRLGLSNAQLVTVLNSTATNWATCSIFRITGIRNLDKTPDGWSQVYWSRSLWMANGFQLIGNSVNSEEKQAVGITAQAIPARSIGYAVVPGIFAAFVRHEIGSDISESPNYARPWNGSCSFLKAVNYGPFRVIAATEINSTSEPVRFAYLIPESTGGHLRGYVATKLGRDYTVNVNGEIYDALSPLAPDLEVGRHVVISRSIETGVWEIISAACEESDE